MKINIFWGDLTNTSAKMEALDVCKDDVSGIQT